MKRTSPFVIVLAGLACLFTPVAAYGQVDSTPGLASLYYSLPTGVNPNQTWFTQQSSLQANSSSLPLATAVNTPLFLLLGSYAALPGGATGSGGSFPTEVSPNTYQYFFGYYSGVVNITTSGAYTFSLDSDDGSMAWIDGQQVVYNNYFQAANATAFQQSGTVNLSSGYHQIAMGFYQGGGGYGFEAAVSGPDNGNTTTDLGTALAQPNLIPDMVPTSAQINSFTGALDPTKVSASGPYANLIVGTDGGNSTFSGNLAYSDTAMSAIAGLFKSGTGSFTVTGSMTYGGATTIGAGTLQFGNGASGHDPTISIGPVTNYASLVYNVGSSQTASYLITGTGSLTKAGPGTLTLSGNLGYTGPTYLKQGTLALNAPAAAGLFEGLVAGGNNSYDTTDPVQHGTIQPVARWGAVAGNASANVNSYPIFGNNTTWGYAGYIDNTSDHAITYTFGKNFDDGAYLAIDGKPVINDNNWQNYPVAQVSLSPGLHALDLRFGQGGGGYGPNNNGGNSLGDNGGGPYGTTPYSGTGSNTGFGIAFNTVGNESWSSSSASQPWLQIGSTSDANTKFFAALAGNPYSALVMSSSTTLDISSAASGIVALGSLADAAGSPTGAKVTLGSNMLETGFDNTNTVFSGAISGTGGLIKTGNGMFTLAGVNTYTGATSVNSGILDTTSAAALPGYSTAGKVSVASGATVAVQPGTSGWTAGQIDSLRGAVTWTDSTAALGIDTSQGNFTYGSSITQALTLTKMGSNTLTLTGVNTNAGGTNINQGTINVSADTALSSASLSFTGNGTLQAGANLAMNSSRVINLNTGVTGSIDTQTFNVSVAGQITGQGALTKVGAGTLTLTGNNDYTGHTNVTNGTLVLNPQATPTGGLFEGLVANQTNGWDTTDPIPHSSNQSVARWGASTSADGNNDLNANVYPTWGNNTTWGYSGFIDNTSDHSVTYTFGKNFDDNGLIKIDGKTVINDTSWNNYPTASITLAPGYHSLEVRFGQGGGGVGPNNGSGTGDNGGPPFNVTTGTTSVGYGLAFNTVGNTSYSSSTASEPWLQVGNSTGDANTKFLTTIPGSPYSSIVLSTNTKLDISSATTGVVGVGSLADASSSSTGQVTLGSNNLELGFDNTSTLFSGVISGAGGLIKTGGGTFTLAGANTYSGGTTLFSGEQAFASPSALPATPAGAISFAGGALKAVDSTDYSSRFATTAGQQYSLDTNGNNVTWATPLASASGSVTKSGSGTLTLTAANPNLGTANVVAGILMPATTASLPSYGTSGSVTVQGGATIAVPAGGAGDWTNGQITTLATNANWASTTSQLGIDTTHGSYTYSGALTQPMTLNKLGPNTLVLTGAHTNAGGAIVSGGSLQLGNGSAGNDGSLTGNVNNNGALIYNLAGNQTYTGMISGSGGMTKTGPGTLALTGASTYGGATTVTNGTITFTGQVLQGGQISLNVGPGAAATVGGSFALSNNNTVATVTAHGDVDIWSGHEQAYMGYIVVPTTQPFDVSVHMQSLTLNSGGGSTWCKTGIMARADNSQTYVDLAGTYNTPGSQFCIQAVGTDNDGTNNQAGPSGGSATGSVPGWMRLVYDGAGNFTGYYDTADTSATTVPDPSSTNWLTFSAGVMGETGITANPNMLLGLGIGTHDTGSQYTAVYDNISQWSALATLGPPSNLLPTTTTLMIGASGKVDFAGGSQQVVALSDVSGAGGIVTNSANVQSVLTLTPSGSTTFSGSIKDGSSLGTIALVVNGSGVQALAGSNSYSGGTKIIGGVLSFLKKSAMPTTGTVSVSSGATVGLGVGTTSAYYSSDDLDAAFAGTLTNVTSSPGSFVGIDTSAGNFTYASSIAPGSTVGLTKLGPNTLTLTGANAYTGNTNIKSGILNISDDTNIPNSLLNFTGDGATLQAGGNLTLNSNRSVQVNNVAATIDTQTYNVSMSGPLLGNGTLTKAGAGNLTLSGPFVYSGKAVVSGGSLTFSPARAAGLLEGLVSSTNGYDKTSPIPFTSIQPVARWGASTDNSGTSPANMDPSSSNPLSWPNNTTIGYSGYMEVLGNKPVTYTFGENFDDFGYLYIDGAKVIDNHTWNSYPTAQITLTPGFHTVNLRFGQGTGGVGPNTASGTGDNGGYPYGVTVGGTNVGYGMAFNTVGNTSFSSSVASEPWLQMGDSTDDPNTKFFATSTVFPALAVTMSSNTTLNIAGASDMVGVGSLGDTPGSPTGAKVLLGSNSLQVGLDNTNTTFSGSISGAGGLFKEGTGILVLAGANTYSGGTMIDAGTLVATTGTALPGGMSLTVGAGGTFVYDPAYPTAGAVAGGAVSAVPEPGTLALLVAGAIVAFAAWRRKRK